MGVQLCKCLVKDESNKEDELDIDKEVDKTEVVNAQHPNSLLMSKSSQNNPIFILPSDCSTILSTNINNTNSDEIESVRNKNDSNRFTSHPEESKERDKDRDNEYIKTI